MFARRKSPELLKLCFGGFLQLALPSDIHWSARSVSFGFRGPASPFLS
jgi:hypothetical protein